MSQPPADQLPPEAQGYHWASQILSVALLMTLPSLGGYALDQWLGTIPGWLIVGAVFGLVGGLTQLVRITTPRPRGRRRMLKQ